MDLNARKDINCVFYGRMYGQMDGQTDEQMENRIPILHPGKAGATKIMQSNVHILDANF